MLKEDDIRAWMAEYSSDEDLFVVEVRVPHADEVIVEVDRDSGISSDECSKICRDLSAWIEEQGDDASVTVSSPGLTAPLRIPRQFLKNVGRDVEVLHSNGLKVCGRLLFANDAGFTVEVIERKRLEGDKRPRTISREEKWHYDEVKQVKLIIGKR